MRDGERSWKALFERAAAVKYGSLHALLHVTIARERKQALLHSVYRCAIVN
jgi:hypothetical protein